MANIPFSFIYTTQEKFNAKVADQSILSGGIYFISDTHRIYRGSELMSATNVMKMATVPTSEEAVENVLYLVPNGTDYEVYTKVENTVVKVNGVPENIDLSVFAEGVVAENITDENATSTEAVPTVGAVTEYVGAVKNEIDGTLGNLEDSVNEELTTLKGSIKEVTVSETSESDSTKFSLVFTTFDGNTTTIDLDKEAFKVNSVDALTTIGEAPNGVPADLKLGQQVIVNGKVYYLVNIDEAKTDGTKYTWESLVSTWNDTTDKVNFEEMTYATYSALETVDENTIYVITDKKIIFKGDVDVTSSVELVETFDSLEGIDGKLYIHKTTLQARVYNGNEYVEFIPGILNDTAAWADADGSKLATIALVKKGIAEAIATISTAVAFESSTGTVTVGEDSTAVLTSVAHAPTYDSATLTLTIPVYGQDDLVVNIPKDKFVTAGKYNEETGNIELTIDGQEEKVVFPASALVDVYVANNEGKNITVTVTDDNKISANLTLDPTAGNALVYTEQGFMVDISGKMDTYEEGNASELVLSDADGKTVARSGVTILSDGDLGTDSTKIPVASVIASAIATAINTAKESLTTLIDGKMDKLTGTAEDSGKIAVVNSDGSTVTIGTLKLSEILTVAEASNTYATKQSVTELENSISETYATKEEMNNLLVWTEI